jgi:hypothetical protein
MDRSGLRFARGLGNALLRRSGEALGLETRLVTDLARPCERETEVSGRSRRV